MFERDAVAETEKGDPIPDPDREEGHPTTALYLDDLRVGERFTSGSLRVEEADIKAFAAQFDPLDDSAARRRSQP